MVDNTRHFLHSTCPDFASAEYAAARQVFLSAEVTDAEAVSILQRAWTANNLIDRARQQRQAAEAAATAAAEAAIEAQRETDEQALQEAKEMADAEDLLQEDKKKNRTKYAVIPMRDPPTVRAEIISPYAQRKLERGFYVELSYFTKEGLQAARKTAGHAEDEAMLPIVDPVSGSTSWVPAAAKRESFSFKDNEDLSWEDFTIAAPRMLLAFQHAKWPESRIKMFSEFWGNILRHRFRLSDDPLDIKTLLVYQAEQRRDWHHAIFAPNGAWNLGVISEDLLKKTSDLVYRAARERVDKELRAQVSV
ncbi:hypothetical protein M422DRAFT_173607 [Sphaerobolus stellatus SS14]|uniref:Uncharacterized protein n=1 Tax=Sphaerobolus stellatus (strain SS14) TaxID=990650 RepID=A0A0C9V082_SPHS4|nr:hypothetical protein M422DRAFT_173607 [Sphaerobolus stellatus SS14]